MDLKEVHANAKDLMTQISEAAIGWENKKDGAIEDHSDGEGKSSYSKEMIARSLDRTRKEQMMTIEKVTLRVGDLAKFSNLTKAEKEYAAKLKEGVAQYANQFRQLLDLAKDSLFEAQCALGEVNETFRTLNGQLHELMALEGKLSKDQYVHSGMTFRMVFIVSIVVFVAAIIVPFGISIIMRTLILIPINKTIEVIEAVAGGDLTRRIDAASKDEIGEMATHFNVFAEKLQNTIVQVAESSEKVSGAANRLDSATEQMALGVERVATQVNAVAAASEEMSKTSAEIAGNCATAVQSSEEANRTVNAGSITIKETIDVMNRINSRVRESSEAMRILGNRSEQIGKIVGLINDVAEQTHLLALNATVESARAGEQGHGFAVVADEVRGLAERTSKATKEISETILGMQAETKHVLLSMEEGVHEVEAGMVKAANSGEALKEILARIDKATEEINQIATASEEETATIDEIAGSIQQISQVMSETALRIQDDANASSQLAELAKGLNQMVGQFRL